MTDYKTFCAHYSLDPETEEARAQYEEAQRQLDLLERAASRYEATEDDRPDAAVQAAIAEHGAEAVHRAAQAQLEGDGGAAMLAVGIEPATAGDCWRAMSFAHDAMDEEQRQRVETRNDAALDAQAGGLPVAVVAASESGLEEIEALPPTATLASAKAAVAARGYRVIDVGEGGQCETTASWRRDGTVAHVVTVEPPGRQ